jgi:valyl-tRNA synthetase
MPQWFVKTKSLAKPAIEAVRKGKIKIVPKKRFEKMYFDWMENIQDWNISRQIVWGPRIPIWYCLTCNPNIQLKFISKSGQKVSRLYSNLQDKYSFEEISSGMQSLVAAKNAIYQLEEGKCKRCKGNKILQDTDTFDTWFLSGQWPINTLKSKPGDFEYFYPTSVLDTLWDILFFWVGRMMMFGLYLTNEIPFEVVHIHARVVDKSGKKMSKSKGNVIDPIEMVNKYGADALRMALVMGVAPASDIAISDEKVMGMRNFANKIWNIGRYIETVFNNVNVESITFSTPKNSNRLNREVLSDLEKLTKEFTKNIEKYYFGQAAELIYDFSWHVFADKYIEASKNSASKKDPETLYTLRHVYLNILKLIHPFMPFVTEAVWQELKNLRKYPKQSLITASWPLTSP